jgi:RES domain-containing protein
MQLFRIARKKYSRDLSGIGASLAGGRWNPRGAAVLYTSETRALATLEYLVHVPLAMIPGDLTIITLDIPGNTKEERIAVAQLPKSWRSYPAPRALAGVGAEWLRQGQTLLLRVPSAIVTGECNVLINPAHPGMARVSIADIQPFSLDARLTKR